MQENRLLLNSEPDNYLLLNESSPDDYLLLSPTIESINGNVYTQFINCPNINGILNGVQPLITIDVDQFYSDFFDIDTCNKQGLDQWAALLNITRTINVPNFANVFGFDTGQTPVDNVYPCNFGMGNFYDGQTIPSTLGDDDLRSLLRLRYNYITTSATVKNANEIMNVYVQTINPTYKCIVAEISPMEIQFQFNFTISNEQYIIFRTEGVMPVPAGVAYTLLGNAF